MRIGVVILPEYRWSEAAPRWRAAEEYGFAHAWTYDHLGWRTLLEGPWFGAFPTLTAAAMVTSRITLGPMVSTPNYRHPAALARELTAVDDISDGRLMIGLGAGGGGVGGYDSTVFGQPPLRPARAADRYAEFVELLDVVLTSEPVQHEGEFFTARGARSNPGCVTHPRSPFILAANGPRGMDLAARFAQGWVTTGIEHDDEAAWWGSLRQGSTRFTDALTERQRDPASVRRFLQADASPVYALSSVEHFRDIAGRAGELGFTDVIVPWPRAGGVYAGSDAVLDEVADELSALRAR